MVLCRRGQTVSAFVPLTTTTPSQRALPHPTPPLPPPSQPKINGVPASTKILTGSGNFFAERRNAINEIQKERGFAPLQRRRDRRPGHYCRAGRPRPRRPGGMLAACRTAGQQGQALRALRRPAGGDRIIRRGAERILPSSSFLWPPRPACVFIRERRPARHCRLSNERAGTI